jgi:hypothetical protein
VPHKNLHFLTIILIFIIFFVLCQTKYGELYIENSIIMQRPHMYLFPRTRDLVEKFGAIPDLFEGGPSSTQNYRATSRGNSINLTKVPNEFQKISNLVVASQKVFGA